MQKVCKYKCKDCIYRKRHLLFPPTCEIVKGQGLNFRMRILKSLSYFNRKFSQEIFQNFPKLLSDYCACGSFQPKKK